MGSFSYSELRDLCDEYFDPRKAICGGGTTLFHVGGLAHIKDKAETALNFYNKKKRKNFVLDKVVKVNRVSGGACYCMTFWAKRDENDERCLFRGVYCLGDVLLCEIKDGDCEITIPAGHVDGVPGPSAIRTDDPLYEWHRDVQLFYSFVIGWEFIHSCFKFVLIGKSYILVVARDALTTVDNNLKSCVVFANFSDGDCDCAG